MDAQVRLRLVLYSSVLAIVIIAATQPTTQAILLAAILVPFAFLLVAAFLLGGPYLAMGHAEGERVPWRKALDFIEHNGILSFLDVMLLWTTAFVAGIGFVAMPNAVRAIYVIAVLTGLGAGLADWFLTQERDARQNRWQNHPTG